MQRLGPIADEPLRIALSAPDFDKLVRGQPTVAMAASGQRVMVILSDIGFSRMLAGIRDAMRGG